MYTYNWCTGNVMYHMIELFFVMEGGGEMNILKLSKCEYDKIYMQRA